MSHGRKASAGEVTTRRQAWPGRLAVTPSRSPIGLVILVVCSCGPIQSAQVVDQINGMVGLSKEHVLSCIGPPSSTAQVGTTEVWAYNSVGAINSSTVLSGNQSLAFGSTTTSQEFCAVNLTMQSDHVVAANYRSQGNLLAPSLPCYTVLHACVPNPVSASAQVDRTKEAVAYCKELYTDPRLDPIRGVVAMDQPPTLGMQSNSAHITDVQRPALDAFRSLNEQCRNKIAANNPRLWQIMEKVNPHPYEYLVKLYKAQITIGDYNTYRQQITENFRAAVAVPVK